MNKLQINNIIYAVPMWCTQSVVKTTKQINALIYGFGKLYYECLMLINTKTNKYSFNMFR